jgi:hypothetical protein
MKASSTSTHQNRFFHAAHRGHLADSSSLDGDGSGDDGDDGNDGNDSDDARSPFTLADHDQPSLNEQPTGCGVNGTPVCPG